MIRVKDSRGEIVPGVFKNSSGAVIIKNDTALEEFHKSQRMIMLEKKIEQLESVVNSLLNILKESQNGKHNIQNQQ